MPKLKRLTVHRIDEYKGHCVLQACRQADITKLKKNLSTETCNFVHPYTGDTPLHCVSMSIYPKRKQVIDILIRKGTMLNEKNKNLLTPLHIAADHSLYEIIDTLLKNGAKVNALGKLHRLSTFHVFLLNNLQMDWVKQHCIVVPETTIFKRVGCYCHMASTIRSFRCKVTQPLSWRRKMY